MRRFMILPVMALILRFVGTMPADDPVFSGPQVGEKLTAFKVRGAFEPDAGKDLDFVSAAKGKPIVLVFVHEANRPSIGLTRILTTYTKSRAKDGLTTGVVWLSDDATEAENTLKRIKHALAEGVPTGIFPDGREGPGSYGLNRKVTLTILVGNKDKVTANFALVQPSLQADLPKILDAVVKEVGGKAPKLEEIEGLKEMKKEVGKEPDPNLRALLRPVIQKDAKPEDVDKAAKAVEEYVAKNEPARAEVGRIANTIINAGKLEDYGTARAQEYLKKWAKEYGSPKKDGALSAVPHFDTEIIPVFTKAGCNAGACHGAAAGRGGFHLSLFGGDPAADYEAIVHELEGRRVNLARPGESLLLAKPTGNRGHQGGIRLEEDGLGAQRLAAWIVAGAPRPQARRLTHFEVSPARRVVDKAGTEVSLRATARFDDGRSEDVTAWTVFTASDPTAVEIDPDAARATVRRGGQHVVIGRFLDRVVPLQMTLPLADTPVDLAREPRNSFIDDEVLKTLAILRLPVSPAADDATFLRRVRLDLTGALPGRDEVEAFLADRSADKRARLVDRLLQSDAFVDYWTFRLATLLRLHPLANEKEGALAFQAWLREQIRTGAPMDQVARALLTAVGDSHVVGPANFARLAADARGQAELISQVFLGVRLQCANCHNHPLDRWTQDDYHGLAAVFARLERGRVVKVASRGAVTNPRTGEPALPRIPGVRSLAADSDGRDEFAQWLTAPDNPYFARALVNRLWRAMFGRGLVEPADDLRDTNPATHPELLDRLAADFVQHGHDIRHTLRLIARSATYGRSGAANTGNRADDRFYSHAYRRPLDPEVLADALADVTGVSDRYGDEPLGTRAVSLFDPRTPAPSLDILGRCSRQASCEGTTAAGGLPAKLHQLNGELINRKIAARDGCLHRLLTAGKTDDEIVTDFYYRGLGRPPTGAEREVWQRRLAEAGKAERAEWLEDFVWGLLSCSEFSTNH
jgi:hypothetical protein